MPESNPWVRVTDKETGHRLSVRESAVAHGNYNVLKQDAVDPLTGEPLPPEFKTETGQSADTKKES